MKSQWFQEARRFTMCARYASPGTAAMTSLEMPTGCVSGAVKLCCNMKSSRLLQPTASGGAGGPGGTGEQGCSSKHAACRCSSGCEQNSAAGKHARRHGTLSPAPSRACLKMPLTVQVDVDAAVVVQQEVAQHVHPLDAVGVGHVGGQEPGVVLLRHGAEAGRRRAWPVLLQSVLASGHASAAARCVATAPPGARLCDQSRPMGRPGCSRRPGAWRERLAAASPARTLMKASPSSSVHSRCSKSGCRSRHDCRAAAHLAGTCLVCHVWCISLGTGAAAGAGAAALPGRAHCTWGARLHQATA